MTVHSFDQNLSTSKNDAESDFWLRLYRERWPSLVAIRSEAVLSLQKLQVDRWLYFDVGSPIWVEEKVRDKDYGDILLERWSDRDRRIPGWVQKRSLADYFAYVIKPTERAYIINYPELQALWWRLGRAWINKAEKKVAPFKICLAENFGYTTESVAVPVKILREAIEDFTEVNFAAEGPR